jgi:hypothetical protein
VSACRSSAPQGVAGHVSSPYLERSVRAAEDSAASMTVRARVPGGASTGGARRFHPSWVRHPAIGVMRLGARLVRCRATTRHTATVRRREITDVAIGPVQLGVLGFRHPDFHGRIIEEPERLRESDTVRVSDALAVYKTGAGDLEAMHLSRRRRSNTPSRQHWQARHDPVGPERATRR